MKRMTEPAPGENYKAYEIFKEIKGLLHDVGIWSYHPYFPLMPEGNITEMLQGKTEPVTLLHRTFCFDFKATMIGKKDEKAAAVQKLRECEHFAWAW